MAKIDKIYKGSRYDYIVDDISFVKDGVSEDILVRRRGRRLNIRSSLMLPHPQCKSHELCMRDKINWLIPVPTGINGCI